MKRNKTTSIYLILPLLIAPAIASSCSRPDGRSIFIRENCTKCHVFNSTGIGRIDLTDVIERRSETWIRDQIRNPRLHRQNSGMPGFGHLSEREIESLISFFKASPEK